MKDRLRDKRRVQEKERDAVTPVAGSQGVKKPLPEAADFRVRQDHTPLYPVFRAKKYDPL